MSEAQAKKNSKFPVLYTVDNVEPWTVLDKLSNPQQGYRITFTFEPGFTSYVEVTRVNYNPDFVRAAIETEIMRNVQILSL